MKGLGTDQRFVHLNFSTNDTECIGVQQLKKIPLGIFSLFPTLMGHIFLDHPLMFFFVGWGFFKEGIKSDLS